MINQVVLTGRLTRDPEVRYLPSGTPVANFSLAVNRRIKKQEVWQDEANYFDLVWFGSQVESLKTHLTKGKLIGVTGELRQRQWETEGQKRSKVEVLVQRVTFFPTGQGSGSFSQDSSSQKASVSSSPTSPSEDVAKKAGMQEADDLYEESFIDDIPF